MVHRESLYEEHILIGSGQTNYFSVNRLNITGKYTLKSDHFHVGIITRGDGIIKAGEESIPVNKGDKFQIPYKTKEVVYTTSTELEIVFSWKQD